MDRNAVKFGCSANGSIGDGVNANIVFKKGIAADSQLFLERSSFAGRSANPATDAALICIGFTDLDHNFVFWVCEHINALLRATLILPLLAYENGGRERSGRKKRIKFFLDLRKFSVW